MMEWTHYTAGGHLVLVVDDNARIRAYIKMTLQSSDVSDFQILEANDGLEALDLLRVWGSKIALVITDIRMPRMTGRDLATALRLDYPGIPLIFISGEPVSDGLNDPQKGLLFIEKPFAPNALLDAARLFLKINSGDPLRATSQGRGARPTQHEITHPLRRPREGQRDGDSV